MPSFPTDRFQILAPPSQFADLGIFIANAMQSSLEGAWFFNKFSGEADADAKVRCSYNWAPGAANGQAARTWNAGPVEPTFFTDYATIPNLSGLKTGLPDFGAGGGCVFALARCDFATVGSPTTSRANICGAQGNAGATRGWGMQFAASSTGTCRATDYATAAPTTPVNNQLTTAANDLNKWRLFFGRTGTALKMTNVAPADGSAPDPVESPLASGRVLGTLNFVVGGYPTGAGAGTFDDIKKQIAFCLRFKAVPTASEYAAIVAQCNDLRSETGIVYGAATP